MAFFWAGMFDFRHPSDKQVLLNADGSIRSVGPIRHIAPVATSITPGPAPENAATTTDTSRLPGLPVGVAAGALPAAGATGTLRTLRRRASRGVRPRSTGRSRLR
ncbi:hypothetical protein [Streptomyces sp. NPDC005485]|uniref:hypothetical protein n=1 Tax=Streptomyces sp. NPDC005485 TaxID=3155591 RepID=UPI0033B8C964